jgi:hypothetical protein
VRNRGSVNERTGVADRITVAFLRWIWRFASTDRPRILAGLDAHRRTTEVVVLRSRRDVRRFLTRVGGVASAPAQGPPSGRERASSQAA